MPVVEKSHSWTLWCYLGWRLPAYRWAVHLLNAAKSAIKSEPYKPRGWLELFCSLQTVVSIGDRLEGSKILHRSWGWMRCHNSVRHEGWFFRGGRAGEAACLARSRAEGWAAFPFVGDKWLCPSCVGLGLLQHAKVLPGRAAPCITPPVPTKDPARRFWGWGGMIWIVICA